MLANGGPASSTLPASFVLHHSVHWGYGCGGHCAFNFSGESDVVLAFDSNHTVTVLDTGELITDESYPESSAEIRKAWNFSWKGSWKEADGARELHLQGTQLECENTRTTGAEVKPEKCKVTPTLVLCCAASLAHVITGEETNANTRPPPQRYCGTVPCEEDELAELEANGRMVWICRPSEEETLAHYPGTNFPWVFGLGEQVGTVTSQDGFPETTYVLYSDAGH